MNIVETVPGLHVDAVLAYLANHHKVTKAQFHKDHRTLHQVLTFVAGPRSNPVEIEITPGMLPEELAKKIDDAIDHATET
jgi:hypothetical protein